MIAAKHEFVFDGSPVTLSLPGLDKDTVPSEQRRIECYKWKSVGRAPLEYKVNSLDIEMEVGDTIRVPEPVRHLHPNQFGLFKPHEQKHLDQIVAETGAIVRRAFEYWLRMLRWKSGIGYIGEPSISYAGAHDSGAVLRDRLSGHRMWLQSHVISVGGTRPVTSLQWDATQAALTAGKLSPVWFEFLFESEMRINNNDLIGAVLNLAIALEVNVRTIFSHDLKTANIEPVVIEIFDQTNLRTLLNRIRKMRRWDKEWEKATDLTEIHNLMNHRDRVMHSGETENLDAVKLRKMHTAVKKFAYFTCDRSGLS